MMRSLTMLCTAAILLLITLVFGCYERAAIPARATPAAATIAVQFNLQVSKNAFESFADDMRNTMKGIDALQADIVALLKRDLQRKNIGVVARDASAADLVLEGVTRNTAMNVFVTDWQLIDPTGNLVVRAGTADWGPFPSSEAIVDQILTDLVTVDLARYGTVVAPVVVVAPTPTPTAPTTARSATSGDNAWAVVIGVERYREQLAPATFADNDAVAFAKTLEETLNVPASHIKVLRGDRAARADIASVIEEWLPKNARAKDGRVYVFFSGHGAPDVDSGDAYLVPFDADPAYLKTRGYSIKQLYAALAALKDQHTFVFLDACFSGSGDRSVLAEGTRPLVPVKTPAVVGGIVSYAAAQPQQTTGGDVARQHGLFTAHVLDALRGSADANADGNVDVDELRKYVDTRVETAARLSNREQLPVLSVPKGVAPASVVLVQGLTR